MYSAILERVKHTMIRAVKDKERETKCVLAVAAAIFSPTVPKLIDQSAKQTALKPNHPMFLNPQSSLKGWKRLC